MYNNSTQEKKHWKQQSNCRTRKICFQKPKIRSNANSSLNFNGTLKKNRASNSVFRAFYYSSVIEITTLISLTSISRKKVGTKNDSTPK